MYSLYSAFGCSYTATVRLNRSERSSEVNEQDRPYSAEFDQKYRAETAHEIAGRIERDCLVLADAAIRFAAVERVPRYTPEKRENDAEHSYMLGLVAQEIATVYFPELDAGLVAQFSLVHDLIELKTGDVATFSLSDENLHAKATAEAAALDELCNHLPKHTALLVRVYEEQAIAETRFVRFVDKLLPVLVDILGPGSQVMHEDYATFEHEQLEVAERALSQRFESMFPEPELAPIHLARNGLARKFSELFQPLPRLQDVLF